MFHIKKYILGVGLILLIGCSNNKITSTFYGTYISTPEKEYPFSYQISIFNDNTLWFHGEPDNKDGIYGKYSTKEEDMDVFILNIDSKEIIINLDRDKMEFEFPIEYDGLIYLVIFKKIDNDPIVSED